MRSPLTIILNVLVSLLLFFVFLEYLVRPFLDTSDFGLWFDSPTFWSFLFGLLSSILFLFIINKPVVCSHRQVDKPQDTVASCYCCNKEVPVTEMKILLVCEQCQMDQNVE